MDRIWSPRLRSIIVVGADLRVCPVFVDVNNHRRAGTQACPYIAESIFKFVVEIGEMHTKNRCALNEEM